MQTPSRPTIDGLRNTACRWNSFGNFEPVRGLPDARFGRLCAVIPLLPRHAAPPIPFKTLNPIVSFDGAEYVLMTQNIATIPVGRLRAPIGTLASHRDQIIRAMDALFSGI